MWQLLLVTFFDCTKLVSEPPNTRTEMLSEIVM
jgi:hypothetical protein